MIWYGGLLRECAVKKIDIVSCLRFNDNTDWYFTFLSRNYRRCGGTSERCSIKVLQLLQLRCLGKCLTEPLFILSECLSSTLPVAFALYQRMIIVYSSIYHHIKKELHRNVVEKSFLYLY